MCNITHLKTFLAIYKFEEIYDYTRMLTKKTKNKWLSPLLEKDGLSFEKKKTKKKKKKRGGGVRIYAKSQSPVKYNVPKKAKIMNFQFKKTW